MKAEADRVKLSVCIIAFNEQEHIRRCLESVAWADEVIVVDSLSSDATVRIAREFTDRVVQRPWPGYVAQKNFALEQASCDWALSLDADERVSTRLAGEIKGVLRSGGGDCLGYTVPRRTFYLGRWMSHGGWYPDRKLRLVRRGAGRWGGSDPHDHLYVEGKVGALKGDLLHYTYRDLSDHVKTVDRFTSVAAAELLKGGSGLTVCRMVLHPPARMARMYLAQLGLLDGVPGLIAALMSGYYVFLKYAKLWELRRQARGEAAPEQPGAEQGRPAGKGSGGCASH